MAVKPSSRPTDRTPRTRSQQHDGAISETGDIVLKVPPRIGEHVWRFVLPAHEIGRHAI